MPMKLQEAAMNAYSRSKTHSVALEGDADLVGFYYIWMNPNTGTGKQRRRDLIEDEEGRNELRLLRDRLEARFPREVAWPAPRCPP